MEAIISIKGEKFNVPLIDYKVSCDSTRQEIITLNIKPSPLMYSLLERLVRLVREYEGYKYVDCGKVVLFVNGYLASCVITMVNSNLCHRAVNGNRMEVILSIIEKMPLFDNEAKNETYTG